MQKVVVAGYEPAKISPFLSPLSNQSLESLKPEGTVMFADTTPAGRLKRRVFSLVLFAAFLILLALFALMVTSLDFLPGEELTDKLWNRVWVLGTITIILERSLEILMTTWRGADARALTEEIQILEDEKRLYEEQKGGAALHEMRRLQQKMAPLKKELGTYKQDTLRYAMWVGLGLGCLAAALGVDLIRALAVNYDDLYWVQKVLVAFVDILLTGGLLAGGSDLFHKFIEIYMSFTSMARDAMQGDRKARKVTVVQQPAAAPSQPDAPVQPVRSNIPIQTSTR